MRFLSFWEENLWRIGQHNIDFNLKILNIFYKAVKPFCICKWGTGERCETAAVTTNNFNFTCNCRFLIILDLAQQNTRSLEVSNKSPCSFVDNLLIKHATSNSSETYNFHATICMAGSYNSKNMTGESCGIHEVCRSP